MRDEQPLDQDVGVSDVARALSSIAPALSAVTRRHLSALLAHTIASPTAAEIRGRRLGLVCEMVSEPGALGVQRYEALRSARTGEGWPAASTLIAHFGSWQAVLTVAMRLQQYGQSMHPIRGSHRALHNSARNYCAPRSSARSTRPRTSLGGSRVSPSMSRSGVSCSRTPAAPAASHHGFRSATRSVASSPPTKTPHARPHVKPVETRHQRVGERIRGRKAPEAPSRQWRAGTSSAQRPGRCVCTRARSRRATPDVG